MKRHIIGALMTVVWVQGLAFGQNSNASPPAMEPVENMAGKVTWIEQAATMIKAGAKTIYIDPYVIKKNDQADIILITHSHGDHLSPPDIAKVIAGHTLFIAPEDCAPTIQAEFGKQALSGKCEVLIKERSR